MEGILIEHKKCILDSVDQRNGMGQCIDLYDNNTIVVCDAGDYHSFKVTNEQLKQIEDTQSVKVALAFK